MSFIPITHDERHIALCEHAALLQGLDRALRTNGQSRQDLHRIHALREIRKNGGLVPDPVPISSTFSLPSSWRSSLMSATTAGCDIV